MHPVNSKTSIHLVVAEPTASKGIVADAPRWLFVLLAFLFVASWGGIFYFAEKLLDR